VDFPLGGTVRARSVVGEQLGTIASVRLGLAPNGWKVSASNQQPGWEAAKAVDGNPATFWHTAWDPGFPSHPHTLTIDMQAPTVIAGFRYLPRQDKRVPDSMVSAWRIEGSLDGAAWKTVAEGTFGNILNDPSRRTALFDRPAHIRYFRFVSLAGAEGKPYAGAAEIDLLSPE
jgi:alpha-L-fucosidase